MFRSRCTSILSRAATVSCRYSTGPRAAMVGKQVAPVSSKYSLPTLRSFHLSCSRHVELVVNLPPLAESISEGEVATFEIAIGDYVAKDDPVVMVETDKTTVAVNAPEGGIVLEYFCEEGDTIGLDAPLFKLDTSAEAPVGTAPSADVDVSAAAPDAAPAAAAPIPSIPPASTPAATKPTVSAPVVAATGEAPTSTTSGSVTRVKMTKMRQTTANRLKESQNTAAFLTTFNEIDMSGLFALRKKYKDTFADRHGVKLGFMSAFCKAAAYAAKDQPAVNAFIDGKDIVYHDYMNISVAVSAPKGLVVPVIRNVESKSFVEIETDLRDLAIKAREGKIAIEDMDGGTFTVSNGGVFGSLMGTPIINPPQSAVLGMHGVFDRPIAVDGEVVIRPMMYVALTYDHRLIDGREAVTFLRKVKEGVEDPNWMLLG